MALTQEAAQSLVDAIVSRHLVEITYVDKKGDMTTRTVEPYELKETDKGFYFYGWDVSKDAIRSFKMERFENIQVLDSLIPSPRFPAKVNGQEY